MPTEKRPRVLETANPREGLRQMRGIFWDTDVERLDLEKNKPFIIARMLEKGGMRGMIWVEAVYPAEDIVDALCSRRDFSPVVRNYYLGRYHVPREAVAASLNWWC